MAEPYAAPEESRVRAELRVYRMLVASWSRSAMQYRATFALTVLNGVLVNVFGLVEVLVIFANVHTLAGFGIGEMLYLSGTAQTGFSLAEILFHGSSYVARPHPAGHLRQHARAAGRRPDPGLRRPVQPDAGQRRCSRRSACWRRAWR